ncbi:MAG: hypothetical protein Q8K65_03190 [Alphaproteobacteria bacterium]|nr:hypothetical protein [Alphaproteobacteria bacterium]
MIRQQDHDNLHTMMQQLHRREQESAAAMGREALDFAPQAQSLARVAEAVTSKKQWPLKQEDAGALSFAYNRLIHVFGVNPQEKFMQDARESFKRVEESIWPAGIRRPPDMQRLLNDGLDPAPALNGASQSPRGSRQGYPQKRHRPPSA